MFLLMLAFFFFWAAQRKEQKLNMASQKEPYRLQYGYAGIKFLTVENQEKAPNLHEQAVEGRKLCICSKKEVRNLLSEYLKEFPECEKLELVFLN